MIVQCVGVSVAIASIAFACSAEPKPGKQEARVGQTDTAVQEEHVPDRNVAEMHQANLAPARRVLADYFALHLEGDRRQAARLWCDPGEEQFVGDRLQSHRPYRTNNAAPLVRDSGTRIGLVSISVQILGLDNSNILDGAAYLARQGDNAWSAFCIVRIGLQQPARVLPLPAGNAAIGDPDEPPPPQETRPD